MRFYHGSGFNLLIALLLLPGFLLAESGLTEEAERFPGTRDQRGVLWKIEKENVASGYLFATIHSEDPRVLDLPEKVAKALDQAPRVVLETEMSPEDMLLMLEKLMLPPGESLVELLGIETFIPVFGALSQRGITYGVASRLRPWAAMLLLNMPPMETGEFLDMYLKNRAEQAGIPVFGLESIEEQADLFSGFDLDTQLEMLRATLKYQDSFEEILEKLHQFYLAGDLSGMLEFSEDLLEEEDRELNAALMEKLLDERNHRMLRRMKAHLQERGAFIAVGALHLPGENGLLNLLRQAGYQLTPEH